MIHTFSSTIRRKEMDAVLTCMVDEKVGPGGVTRKLASQAEDFFCVDGAAAFRSPAIAFLYALKALNIQAQSGVVISALAPAWHYSAVLENGWTPVVADVDSDTAQLSAANIDSAVKNGARVVLLNEPLGYMPDMESILALGIPVIEDISQSAGTTYQGAQAGSFGVFAVLGLEERDAVTAGGGALLLAAKRRDSLVFKKLFERAPSIDVLPDINAALAFVQLKEFAKNEERRKELHDAYAEALMQSRHKMFPLSDNVERAAFCFAAVLASGFKDVQQYAAKKGIEAAQAFAGCVADIYPDAAESCVNARSLLLRTALFPLYPRLSNAQAKIVCKTLSTLP